MRSKVREVIDASLRPLIIQLFNKYPPDPVAVSDRELRFYFYKNGFHDGARWQLNTIESIAKTSSRDVAALHTSILIKNLRLEAQERELKRLRRMVGECRHALSEVQAFTEGLREVPTPEKINLKWAIDKIARFNNEWFERYSKEMV